MLTKIGKLITLMALIPLIAGVSPVIAGVPQSQSGEVKEIKMAKGQNQLPAQKSKSQSSSNC